MQTIETVLAEIQQAASAPATDVRYVPEHVLGPFGRQGDIYLSGITAVPDGAVTMGTNQLADGDTIGSRHVVSDGVNLYKPTNFGAVVEINGVGKLVQGYVMEVNSERGQITHPEHATFDLPRGCYQVSHQYDPIMDRRVAD